MKPYISKTINPSNTFFERSLFRVYNLEYGINELFFFQKESFFLGKYLNDDC